MKVSIFKVHHRAVIRSYRDYPESVEGISSVEKSFLHSNFTGRFVFVDGHNDSCYSFSINFLQSTSLSECGVLSDIPERKWGAI
jgi:hypothetical protein